MKRVLYDNYSLYNQYDETKQFIMDEYPELCTVEVEDAEGSISYEPSDDTVYNFIYYDDSDNWDCIWNDLLKYFNDKSVIMFGHIGRWSGTCSGWKYGRFEDCFRDLIEDCDYIRIIDNNGHLEVECSHHDGNNFGEFKILNDKGQEIIDAWEYNLGNLATYSHEHLFKLINMNFYSKLPHFNNYYGR